MIKAIRNWYKSTTWKSSVFSQGETWTIYGITAFMLLLYFTRKP